MHRLLSKQLQRARKPDSSVDWDKFCEQVERTYSQFDQDRMRADRATKLMLDELDEINRSRDETLLNLQLEHDKLDAALRNMGHALAMFDNNGKLLVFNTRYKELFALDDVEIGQHHDELSAKIRHKITAEETDVSLVPPVGDNCTTRALDLTLIDGKKISATYSRLQRGGWIEIYHDVTEQRNAADQINFLARHDSLTTLPNRRVFNEVIVNECQRVKRGGELAVLCLDLDRFKHVNDTLGHPIGDKLLKEAAQRLLGTVSTVDTVSRLGGDEFAVVQIDVPQPEGAIQLSRRIIEALSEPYCIDGHQVVIGTSIGIALAPLDGFDADVLIRNADMALYRAKSDGRGTFCFFETEMDIALQARRELELELRRASICGEFELYYQPIRELSTDLIKSCEALIRWQHPTAGCVPPDSFIPLAEEIGLISEIGEWVVNEACRTAAGWPNEISVSVNISPVQFKTSSLTGIIKRALRTTGLPAGRLELEITEAVLLQDSERTLDILHELRELGVRIAMDDFGTGYSSLSYLRRFPFDKLKIDRTFVKDLDSASGSGPIVRAITDLASSLGMRITAEGVETTEQKKLLQDLKCTEVQGYLVSRPMPEQDLLMHLDDAMREKSSAEAAYCERIMAVS